jgi:hypothetical protein
METHVVHVDSRDRDFERFPAPNAYRVRLPRKYRRVVAARLLGAELPSSYFVFSAALGNTKIAGTAGAGATPFVATIPDGNYTRTTIQTAIALALHDATGHTFSATLDDTTYRLTISSNQRFSIDTRTTAAGVRASDPVEWGLAYFLGFPKGLVTASDAADTVTPPGVVSLNPYTYMFLDIAELANVETGGQFGTENGGKTFAKIPLSPVSFEYVFTGRDVSQTRVGTAEFRPPVQSLDRLSVLFRFHDGNPIDFNGVEHSFSLELTCRVESAPRLRPSLPVADVVTHNTHNTTKKIIVAVPPPQVDAARRRRRAAAAVAMVAVAGGAWVLWRRRRAQFAPAAAGFGGGFAGYAAA